MLGRSRSPDTTQIKKIMALWTELQAPIIERYVAGPADEPAFLSLQAALDGCMQFLQAHRGSSKIQTYVNAVLDRIQPQLAALALDESFEIAVGFFLQHLFTAKDIRLHYLQFLHNLAADLSTQRLQILGHALAAVQKRYPQVRWDKENSIYQRVLLQIFVKAGLMAEYGDRFDALRHHPEYNLDLIESLIQNDEADRAASIAWTCIRENTREDYDLPYLEILRGLYEAYGNELGLIHVAQEMLTKTWDYDDYLRVAAPMNEEEKLAFRKAIYTKARSARARAAASTLCFHLLAEAGNWQKMMELVRSPTTPYSAILRHFDDLVAFNKDGMLRLLFARDVISWQDEDEAEPDLAELTDKLIAAYGNEALKQALRSYGSKSHFSAAAIVKRLGRVLG